MSLTASEAERKTGAGWMTASLLFFFRPLKHILDKTTHQTAEAAGAGRQVKHSRVVKVYVTCFSGILSKDRARWTRVMVGRALIDLGCQRNDWDHTLDG